MTAWYHFADWPLRAKLAALLIFASVLPVLGAALFDFHDARSLIRSQADALLASRADQVAERLDSLLQGYQRAAERLTHLPNVPQAIGAAPPQLDRSRLDELRQLLRLLPENDPNVAVVAILDRAGVVRLASTTHAEGLNLASQPFVRAALNGAAVISEVHVTSESLGSSPAVALAAPVRADGAAAGVALIWVRASSLWAIMHAANELAGTGSYLVLMDQLGIRIGHSGSAELLFRPSGPLSAVTVASLVAQKRFGPRTSLLLQGVRSFPELYQHAVAHTPDGRGFGGVSGFSGKWSYAVGRRLASVPWTIFCLVPAAELLSPVTELARRKLLVTGTIVLLALLLGILFASSILNPVRSLSQATGELGSGNLHARVKVAHDDELGRLGKSFNAMADRLGAQAQELERARNELEARVKVRTADLERTARVLEKEVTERQLAQERSLASQHLLEGIVGSSYDAIISKTLDGIITSWNPAAEQLFGYSAGEAIGRPMLMIFPPERVDEEPRILERIARGESVDHFETVRLRADGTRLDVSVTISPLRDGQGRIIGASKIARDITERKRQDLRTQAQLERLKLLQQITRAIAERQDLPSIFLAVTGALEEHLPADFACVCLDTGAARALRVSCVGPHSVEVARAVGLPERTEFTTDANGLSRCLEGQLVYEPDLTQVDRPFTRRLAAGGLRSLVLAPLAAESRVFGVLLLGRRASAFSSAECEFLQQVAEHTGLAAQQSELYAALHTAYEDLRRTQQGMLQQERLRALGQMASGIAHDINNAISPITLYTEFLLDKQPELSERTREYLRTIQLAIHDVAATVTRMGEFYREREPQTTLQPVQLNALVQQVLELTRARWSDMALRKGVVIRIETELAPELPVVLGVESEIREALTNLVLNAADAMPQGGTLTVRTRQREADQSGKTARAGRRVWIEVADTGCGMDEDTKRRCLEPFFTTKGERGTGLGLAMVYGIMQRQGAELEIDSAPGLGTTVRLGFPPPLSPAAALPATAGPRAQLRSLRILVIDDDPALLKSLQHALEGHGHVVVTAASGQAGIQVFTESLAATQPFAVVVTDLGMPHVDGRKVAAAVKAAAPHIPVVLLTGWGQRLMAENDVPPHVDRVLSKPPGLAQLLETLAQVTAPLHADSAEHRSLS
jgi:PAS domain S-box-containing protein